MTRGVDPAPEAPSNVASRIVHERGELVRLATETRILL